MQLDGTVSPPTANVTIKPAITLPKYNATVGQGVPGEPRQGDTGILHCHWLPLAVIADMNLRSNLAVIAVIFCRNDSVARG
jgi:hypothetical protein